MGLLLPWLLLCLLPVQAAPNSLSDQLENIRVRKLNLEKTLIEAEKAKKSTENQLTRLKSLQKLQHQEKSLTEKRLQELGKYLEELQSRKEEVQKRVENTKLSLRQKFSKIVHPLLYQHDRLIRGSEGEGERVMKEQILSSVTLSELKELEVLHADLQDVEDIGSRIEQEKQQISSLRQDISEQESLIAFHQKLRESLTQEKHEERMKQWEEYRLLKESEVEIEKMISQFQERKKQEQDQDQKKRLPLNLRARSLPWPLKGKLVGTYGQHRDEKTGLNIFKKGIEILTMTDQAPVVAVMDGRVQFAGEIPGKGKVIILEHPHSVYTIYGGLKISDKKISDEVKASEKLGSMESEAPFYFEIRARNVAIDPLKWLQ